MKYATAAAILAFVAHTAGASPVHIGASPQDGLNDPRKPDGSLYAIDKREPIEQPSGYLLRQPISDLANIIEGPTAVAKRQEPVQSIAGFQPIPAELRLPHPTGRNGQPLAIGRRETIEQLAGYPLRQPEPEPTNILDTPIAIAKRQELVQSLAGLQGLPADARLPHPTGRNGVPLAIGKRGKSKPTPIMPANEVHNVPRGGVNGGGYINPGAPIGTFQPVIQRNVDANEDLGGIPGEPLLPQPTHNPAFGPFGPEMAGEAGADSTIQGRANGGGKREVIIPHVSTAVGLAPVPTIRHGLNKAEARGSVNGGGYIPTEPIGTLVPVIQRDSGESKLVDRNSADGNLDPSNEPLNEPFDEPKIVC